MKSCDFQAAADEELLVPPFLCAGLREAALFKDANGQRIVERVFIAQHYAGG